MTLYVNNIFVKGLNDRKGILMDFLLPITTVLFCVIVVLLLFSQENNLSSSVVSPNVVLELTRDRVNFEVSEYEALKSIYCNSNSLSADLLKRDFCLKFDSLKGVDFLKSNSQLKEGFRFVDSNLCESLYSFSLSGGNLEVERSGLKKERELSPVDVKARHKFFMDLEYSLSKKYLLTKVDC